MRRALIAAVVAALCLPAGAAARVPRDFFGVMANGPLDQPAFALDAESATMRRDGVGTERIEIAWDLVEPQQGQYDYTLPDRKVLAAARAGIDVLGLIVRTPGMGGHTSRAARSHRRATQPTTPRSPRSSSRATGRRASCGASTPRSGRTRCARGRSGTSRTSPSTGRSSPSCAATRGCSNTTYAAIKRADPGATVVMAGLANFSWRDLSRLFRKGGSKLRFDVAAVHPFSGRPPTASRSSSSTATCSTATARGPSRSG